MRPSQKGWVNSYIGLISDHQKSRFFHGSFEPKFNTLSDDQKRYKIIQPTGLMYGHPIRPSGDYNLGLSKWSDNEKMKFILLDSLINDALIINSNDIENQIDFSDCIQDTLTSISNYYRESNLSKNKSSLFGAKPKSETEHIEFVLNQRLDLKSKRISNFWAGFFHNSLLFLDVYYFGKWLRGNKNGHDASQFDDQQENLRLNILKIIAAAAHANNIIEKEEKALFRFFLQSAQLTEENERIAMEYLNTDILLKDITFNKDDSWLIKKYILELAILTVWADKQLEETEKQFIDQLATNLGFTKEEQESSLLAIESFVISNWDKVHFLQSRHNILIIKDRFSKRISHILDRNKKALVQEMNESKELMVLLHKMTKENLSDIEKSKVKAQLIDLLKTLPTFVIVALPGTFITLPLLLNVLPKSAFPSAFSELD